LTTKAIAASIPQAAALIDNELLINKLEELGTSIKHLKEDLKTDIEAVVAGVKAEVTGVMAEVAVVRAEMVGVKAEVMARIDGMSTTAHENQAILLRELDLQRLFLMRMFNSRLRDDDVYRVPPNVTNFPFHLAPTVCYLTHLEGMCIIAFGTLISELIYLLEEACQQMEDAL
jgi:hypothetical protein